MPLLPENKQAALRTANAELKLLCPFCGWTSYNPHDVKQRYCGHCHVFIEDELRRRRWEATVMFNLEPQPEKES